MKRNRMKIKNKADFSFCCPYLSSLTTLPVRAIRKKSPEKQVERYFSTSKTSQRMLINTYVSKESSEKLISKFTIGHQEQQRHHLSVDRRKGRSTSNVKKKDSSFKKRDPNINAENLFKSQVQSFPSNKIDNHIPKKVSLKVEPAHQEIDIFFSEPSLAAIPGVTFKEGGKSKGRPSEYIAICQTEYPNSNRFSGKSKQGRQDLWQKQRRENIETIINRKCFNFQDIMQEYYKRTQNQTPSLIFLFDSKDTWMKSVLLKRGWSENKNKQSKAYHLYWGYKHPIELPFAEQRVNHYPNSHKITTKSGLTKLLHLYGVAYLQPQTYDLDTQKVKVISQYNKKDFINFLHRFLQYCQFQAPEQQNQKQIMSRIDEHIEAACLNQEEELFEEQLKYILKKCSQILQNNQNFTVESCRLHKSIQLINKKEDLEQKHQEMMQTIHSFSLFMKRKGLFARCENIWIVKSKTSSKAAGTIVSSTLRTILKQNNRIVQKYVQNTLLLKSVNFRKFDIRVWLLLEGGGKNIQFYYFKDFYCRICSEPYSLNQDSLKSEVVHLTNYSVNRSWYPDKSSSVMFSDELFDSINQTFKTNFEDSFYAKLQQLLGTAKPIFLNEICKGTSNNYFQLFGVDIILDDELNLHLLEVNMSAKCEERHPRLSSMLESMGEGLLNILQAKGEVGKWTLLV